MNDDERNVDQSNDLNEHPSNNLTVALPPLQQVNDNERNADQNNDFNEHTSNKRPVVDTPLQELNEDQNDADHDQQSTSACHCGFKTNFTMDVTEKVTWIKVLEAVGTE